MDDGCGASVTIPIQGRFGTTRFFLRSPTTGAARISLSFHRSQGGGNHMPRGAKAKAPWPFSTGSESEGQGLQNLITQFTQTSRSLPAKLVQGIRSFDLIPRSSSSSSFLRLVLCRAGSLCRAAAMCSASHSGLHPPPPPPAPAGVQCAYTASTEVEFMCRCLATLVVSVCVCFYQ